MEILSLQVGEYLRWSYTALCIFLEEAREECQQFGVYGQLRSEFTLVFY